MDSVLRVQREMLSLQSLDCIVRSLLKVLPFAWKQAGLVLMGHVGVKSDSD